MPGPPVESDPVGGGGPCLVVRTQKNALAHQGSASAVVSLCYEVVRSLSSASTSARAQNRGPGSRGETIAALPLLPSDEPGYVEIARVVIPSTLSRLLSTLTPVSAHKVLRYYYLLPLAFCVSVEGRAGLVSTSLHLFSNP